MSGVPADVSGTVSLVLDLCITHERWGSTSNLYGHLHYPRTDDIDRPLNEVDTDKIRDHRADYITVPLTLFLSYLLL